MSDHEMITYLFWFAIIDSAVYLITQWRNRE